MRQQNDKIIRDPVPSDAMPPKQRPRLVPDPQPGNDCPGQPSAVIEACIEYERAWRMHPRGASAQKVLATRWRTHEQRLTELRAETHKDYQCHRAYLAEFKSAAFDF